MDIQDMSDAVLSITSNKHRSTLPFENKIVC